MARDRHPGRRARLLREAAVIARRRSKYQPLADYLAAQAGDRVTSTFAEIEGILGAPLPPMAYAATFWASTRTKPQAWRAVGWSVPWRVAHRQVCEQRMTFARQPPDSLP